MKKNLIAVSSVAALLLGSVAVIAHEKAIDGDIAIDGSANSGYANSNGNAVTTGTGECLLTSGASDDNALPACNGVAVGGQAPKPTPVSKPTATKDPVVSVATLGGQALFASNSAELNAAGQDAIAKLAKDLSKFQEISQIVVTGHTDSRGSEAYNQTLSEKRAATVQGFLQKAYPKAAVTAVGMGEVSPRETNATAEGRQANRRVEVQVTAKSVK